MLSFNTDGDFSKNYKFLIGSILPRPIAVVSTRNENSTNNLAPFSFFTAVSASPMIIAICPFIRSKDSELKDTVKNILREKEFVINICTEDIAEKVNMASTELKYGEDEFKFSGLSPVDSEKIKAKRVLESPVHFECIFRDQLDYGSHPGAGRIITGEVVKVHIHESVYEDGKIITSKLKPIGRGAGNDWIKTDSVIHMDRLMKAQIQK